MWKAKIRKSRLPLRLLGIDSIKETTDVFIEFKVCFEKKRKFTLLNCIVSTFKIINVWISKLLECKLNKTMITI